MTFFHARENVTAVSVAFPNSVTFEALPTSSDQGARTKTVGGVAIRKAAKARNKKGVLSTPRHTGSNKNVGHAYRIHF